MKKRSIILRMGVSTRVQLEEVGTPRECNLRGLLIIGLARQHASEVIECSMLHPIPWKGIALQFLMFLQ